MEINMALLGQLLAVWVVFATVLTYILVKKKTETPMIATMIGFVLSFLPPISIIYLIVLVLKNDIISNEVVA